MLLLILLLYFIYSYQINSTKIKSNTMIKGKKPSNPDLNKLSLSSLENNYSFDKNIIRNNYLRKIVCFKEKFKLFNNIVYTTSNYLNIKFTELILNYYALTLEEREFIDYLIGSIIS